MTMFAYAVCTIFALSLIGVAAITLWECLAARREARERTELDEWAAEWDARWSRSPSA